MEQEPDYSKWSTDDLIKRVTSLEQQLRTQTTRLESDSTSPKLPAPKRKPKKLRVYREIDPSKYSTCLIALKFAYLGQRYNGLEYHAGNKTPLPTVEEELWKALNKARLVFPTPNPLLGPGEPNWEGCEYSKCGRTDKGVSAFGQVVAIRVRSNKRTGQEELVGADEGASVHGSIEEDVNPHYIDGFSPSLNLASHANESGQPTSQSSNTDSSSETTSFHPVNDELPYCQILNRLLPPDIRILAWCPSTPADFSARFSCKERQYRYFFTQPAFAPTTNPTTPSPSRHTGSPSPELEPQSEGHLNIPAMRHAARKFTGLHDFRNFCKLDASKQIENFSRRIFHADIQPLSPTSTSPSLSAPAIYHLTIHGSAFLWHQVRHMVAILFLIGQGLETPSLIDELLDVQSTPCKPQYEMADDAPLVLWDCIFPEEGSERRENALEWVYANDSTGMENKSGKAAVGGVLDDMWRVWRKRKMDEILAGSLLDIISTQGSKAAHEDADKSSATNGKGWENRSQKVFQGGDGPRLAGRYIPVMQKPRMESVEAINAKYAKRKGFEQSEEAREQGFRRIVADAGDVTQE